MLKMWYNKIWENFVIRKKFLSGEGETHNFNWWEIAQNYSQNYWSNTIDEKRLLLMFVYVHWCRVKCNGTAGSTVPLNWMAVK